jgi:hypothetical protein
VKLPNGQVLRITRIGNPRTWDTAPFPNLQLTIADSANHNVLLSGSLHKITGVHGAGDSSYISSANICFPDFQGFVLAFQAGATGQGTMFVIFRSGPGMVELAKVFEATGGRLVIDSDAHTIKFLDLFDDPHDYDRPETSCNFCPKRYQITTYTFQQTKPVKTSHVVSKKRFNPQDFVERPLILK